jgi:predicted dehydrogenase
MSDNHSSGQSRRTFLKAAAAAGAALTASAVVPQVYAAGDDTIKVGLVGCGGRGTDACGNVLHAAKNVKIVALGDVFSSHVKGARSRLQNQAKEDEIKKLGNSVDVPDDRCFVGLDAYKKVINNPEVNYVILATPPGFRPLHIEETVNAGKNLFAEKPVAVDGPGIRQVLKAYETADKKGLRIAAGTQRRHQRPYIETMKQIHDGAIGELVLLRAYWNGSGIWFKKRDGLQGYEEKPTDLAYQLYNWYHFVWICGDHIVEQHVHNIDVCNWAMNDHPIMARGMGSRIGSGKEGARPSGDPKDVGNIFDNFAIEFEYKNGARMISQCRQIPGCWDSVSEGGHGTKGTFATADHGVYQINGKRVAGAGGGEISPYIQEHTDLIDAIRNGKPINELKNVAESTATAILGRVAAYTGKEITWDKLINSQQDLMDEAHLTWESAVPVPPVPVPGKYRFS